ncbi:MAG: c-type cytochrome [Acidobacteria bacterium]|nr:c-type cytochrome [Acidobacteriota bacterium]
MLKAYAKIVLFVLLIIAIFIYVGETITSISGEGKGAALSGEVTPEAGEALFWGKGKCSTCHSIGGRGSAIRCPNLGTNEQFPDPVAVRAATRKPGMGAVEYMVESMYNPNAFVVAGFPKGLMTPINQPPISLSDDEIAAITLYLLSQSGEVGADQASALARAQAPFKSGKVQVAQATEAFKLPPGDAIMGKRDFVQLKCYQCHTIEGVQFPAADVGGIGPDLTGIGAIQSASYLAESILDPSAVVVAGQGFAGEDGRSKMPEYHDVMTLRQMLDVTAYLLSLKEAPAMTPAATTAGAKAPASGQ